MHTVEWLTKTTSMELYKNKEHNTKSYDRSVFPATIELHSTTKNKPAASKKYDYYYVKVRGKVVILSVRTDVNFIWNKKPKTLVYQGFQVYNSIAFWPN